MLYVLRALRRSPGLVVTAVLSLGFGIAATISVFSFVNAIQFKDVPFADPVTLVAVEETSTTELCAGCSVGTAYPTFREWHTRARSFPPWARSRSAASLCPAETLRSGFQVR